MGGHTECRLSIKLPQPLILIYSRGENRINNREGGRGDNHPTLVGNTKEVSILSFTIGCFLKEMPRWTERGGDDTKSTPMKGWFILAHAS
jgi:hypothetical protein